MKVKIMIMIRAYSCTVLYLSDFIDYAKYDAAGYCEFVKAS